MKHKSFTKEGVPRTLSKVDYYTGCTACGKVKPLSRLTEIVNLHTQFCIDCLKTARNIKKCDYCSRIFSTSHGSGKCNCRSRPGTNLNRHDYRPLFKKYFITPFDSVYFGIEFEVSSPQRTDAFDRFRGTDLGARIAKLPWMYFKHDGSVNSGFEIVTMPLSWEWIHENIEKFKPIFQLAKEGYKAKTEQTCGLHIHMNKDAFTSFHLYKFSAFHHVHSKFALWVSERINFNYINRYSQFQALSPFEIKLKNGGNRYNIVNVANLPSVEYRLFQGAVSEFSLLKAIEYLKSIYDFTKVHTLDDISNLDNYHKFLKENKKEFLHLNCFVNKDFESLEKIKGNKHVHNSRKAKGSRSK
jgi:hypothetical protein